MISTCALHDKLGIDFVLASGKTGEGIDELERKIVGLLKQNKSIFPSFSNIFRVCNNCGACRREDECYSTEKLGFQVYWYCSEGCLRLREGEHCR